MVYNSMHLTDVTKDSQLTKESVCTFHSQAMMDVAKESVPTLETASSASPPFSRQHPTRYSSPFSPEFLSIPKIMCQMRWKIMFRRFLIFQTTTTSRTISQTSREPARSSILLSVRVDKYSLGRSNIILALYHYRLQREKAEENPDNLDRCLATIDCMEIEYRFLLSKHIRHFSAEQLENMKGFLAECRKLQKLFDDTRETVRRTQIVRFFTSVELVVGGEEVPCSVCKKRSDEYEKLRISAACSRDLCDKCRQDLGKIGDSDDTCRKKGCAAALCV